MGSALELWARAWDAIEAGRLDALDQLFHPDAEFWTPSTAGRGVDFVQGVFARHLQAYPDLTRETVAVVEDLAGDAVAVELIFTGTHLGTLRHPDGGEIPPTGRRLRWAATDHVCVTEGRIASWRAYFDRLSLLAQLRPAPG